MPASTCICLSALCGGEGEDGGGGDDVHANAACVFCFLLLFPMCRISHRFLRCFCRLSTFCTCQLRLAFVFQLCAGVVGGMGGGGDNVHANAACVFCFLLLFPMCRISHRFLRCLCRLSTFCTCQLRLAFVFQLCAGVRGRMGGGGGDDVHANAASVFCFFCCVTSQTLPVAL